MTNKQSPKSDTESFLLDSSSIYVFFIIKKDDEKALKNVDGDKPKIKIKDRGRRSGPMISFFRYILLWQKPKWANPIGSSQSECEP